VHEVNFYFDLMAAYDTVLRTSLVEKQSKNIYLPTYWRRQKPSITFGWGGKYAILVCLPNRADFARKMFSVHLGNDASLENPAKRPSARLDVNPHFLQPVHERHIGCRKFIYADDVCLGTRTWTFTQHECILTADCHKWKNTANIGDSDETYPSVCPVCFIYTVPVQLVSYKWC